MRFFFFVVFSICEQLLHREALLSSQDASTFLSVLGVVWTVDFRRTEPSAE